MWVRCEAIVHDFKKNNYQNDTVRDLFFISNRIFVYGAGRSGLVAKAFAIRLVHLGFQTFVIGETITAPVQEGDLVVIISGSGETIPAVMTAEIAHNLEAHVVSITAKKESEIAKFAEKLQDLLINCCKIPEKLLRNCKISWFDKIFQGLPRNIKKRAAIPVCVEFRGRVNCQEQEEEQEEQEVTIRCLLKRSEPSARSKKSGEITFSYE